METSLFLAFFLILLRKTSVTRFPSVLVCLVRKEGLELIFVFRSETLWIEILYKLSVLESVRQTLLNKVNSIFDDGSRPFCQNDLKSLYYSTCYGNNLPKLSCEIIIRYISQKNSYISGMFSFLRNQRITTKFGV